ncbi:YceI family protein [Parashewanella spongiae]|uniref:YceI family protein n=1 Tax=Parashewanella spongiae TaxID=342950 RepID=A0A3A6U1D9_9GAMM|nr:YceI family protein [Parashewanella spongiae]MCL1076850.1 YceI family protein [Parashewanella spongiae]RJY19218.1 YceI family protein [Parashewanella spongiae]
MKTWFFALAFIFAAPIVSAHEWNVASKDSTVSFVSVKKSVIAEAHSLSGIEGNIRSDGHFELTIPLKTVETGIDIRNERMQSMLFDVTRYPKVILSANLPKNLLKSMPVGTTQTKEIPAQLALHGKIKRINFEVLIVKLSHRKVVVTSVKPTIINASDFNLSSGIKALMQIASLSSISTAVPVSFVLTLKRD